MILHKGMEKVEINILISMGKWNGAIGM